MRSRILDAGIKVAIENHAGDMQARAQGLVEAAGSDIVGVCLDSGNPVWTVEDPHLTLDTLAPYVLTSHMRDSALWKTPEGIAVRWTRMGEGNMGMEDYLRTYLQKCPGRPCRSRYRERTATDVQLREPRCLGALSQPTSLGIRTFLALAEKGKPTPEPPPDPSSTPAARNLANVESSIRWTQARDWGQPLFGRELRVAVPLPGG